MTQLILNQRGSSLSVKEGRYRVRTQDREFFVPVQTVKTIVLHAATRMSHEVAMTAIEHNTDLLFVDRKGFPAGRLWSHQFGSIATIRKHQLAFATGEAGAVWVREWLLRKLASQRAVLDGLALLSSATLPTDALVALDRYADRLGNVPTADLSLCFDTFRGLEGSAGRVYFGAINQLLPETYRFSRRSGRGATDAFNCLLNYAYGMIYGTCESALIQAGIDPFVGVMHRDEYNRPVLVYDFIEPYRAWADYVVCHLLMQEVIFDEFFDIDGRNDGSGQYWLNTSGKRILIQAMNDYLAELVTLEGLSRSRAQHLLLDAQRLASRLKRTTA
ncbi:CRISPR-associated endonuclease Cas1 [Rudanella lutea]|uniref:CRISPR-associated endonuclease Cas1 n=1 Tax=Rudanella lutea TaxID=451374 RepID=UPI00037266DE|nr:CRISPR-associated endonuclease Cas1 [Rudanella lutea]